jgi:Zn-finger nucleic acid-binding protein
MTTAEALNCPNCGGGVSSDSSLCQFCETRLKTVACPSCFGLMFSGAQFCGHCGAVAAPIGIYLDENAGDCPRCNDDLEKMAIGDAMIRGCTKCDGVWVDAPMFEAICADSERQSQVLNLLRGRAMTSKQVTKINYVPCPDCGQLMNRNNFAKASGVVVDVCRDHGVWFDADELPSIIEFIHKGGMEIARERERADIRDERQKLREEQRKLGHTQLPGLGDMLDDQHRLGIRTFIRGLFD